MAAATGSGGGKGGGDLRKRIKREKNKKKDDEEKDNAAINATTGSTTNGDDGKKEEEVKTAWQTFFSHWLIRYVLPILLIYGGVEGHWAIQVRILQNPQSINDAFPFLPMLRPSVGHQDKRQVLIVGTMSSGTRQIASSLHDVLGLEMGHEMSDSLTNYVRDGTVSWIFGIRFFQPPANKKKMHTIIELCQQATYAVGFHPRMYRGGVCSQNQQWSRCWQQECVDLLRKEWGCALSEDDDDDGGGGGGSGTGCNRFQPFQYTLHQTRKPLAVIASLFTKFCTTTEEKRKDFVRITRLLFQHQITEMEEQQQQQQHGHFDQLSCLEVVSYHVIEYNRAMIRARENGFIDGMYKIEQATPCEVAEMAGLGGGDSSTSSNEGVVVYPPNGVNFQAVCRGGSSSDDGENDGAGGMGHQPMKPKRKYTVNNNRVRFTWEDFEGGKHGSSRPEGDRTLANNLKDLTVALGYTID